MFNPGCDFELDKKLSYICDSKTIGHWTDWNGNPDSEYMVVGQDWGTKKYLEKFCVSKRDNTALPYSSTDKNLAVCVKALNSEWDILKSDGIEKNDRYPLYFTNEILCYKDEEKMNAPISGGCYIECAKKYLLEQIDIVNPKAIIFLGAETFRNFVRAAGRDNFNRSIFLNDKFGKIVSDGLENPIFYTTESGKEIRIFPMWHPGRLGVRNAKIYYENNGGDHNRQAIKILEEQWRKIAAKMK